MCPDSKQVSTCLTDHCGLLGSEHSENVTPASVLLKRDAPKPAQIQRDFNRPSPPGIELQHDQSRHRCPITEKSHPGIRQVMDQEQTAVNRLIFADNLDSRSTGGGIPRPLGLVDPDGTIERLPLMGATFLDPLLLPPRY